jgi:hypothetical protein
MGSIGSPAEPYCDTEHAADCRAGERHGHTLDTCLDNEPVKRSVVGHQSRGQLGCQQRAGRGRGEGGRTKRSNEEAVE